MSAVHPEPGLRVGDRYVLTSRIAGGGMGEVWTARDDVLGREVAVKLLRREYADDELFLTRFRAEARHAASLGLPGIASVYDYGEVEGVAYLVMELVPGEPLSARLAREGALPANVAVPLLQQAAAALEAAHVQGLVHRDVKPANLLITPDDDVKITDFGIARAGDQAPITRTGEVMGTAQYLSPEQAMGRTATPASDVYSLGCVAYEALSGRRPFDHDTVVATALAQVNDTPDPLPPNVPGAVAAVVMQSLQKDPARRPASAAAFGAALGAALQGVFPAGAATTAPTQVIAPPDVAPLAGAGAATALPDATSVLGSLPPAAAAAPVPATGTGTITPPPPQRRSGRWVAAVVVLLLVVAAVVAYALAHDGSAGTPNPAATSSGPASSPSAQASSTRPTSSTTSDTSTTTPPTTSTSTTEATITLNPSDYVGRDANDVSQALRDKGLHVQQQKVASSSGKGVVLALSPTDGLHQGDTVTLQVSDGKQETTTSSPSSSPTTSGGGGGGGGGGDGATAGSSPTPTTTSTTTKGTT